MSELVRVSGTENPDRIGDVVFVHGLGGNSGAYWMSDEKDPSTYWPAWLGEERPDLGIWSLDYDASKFRWQGTPMPLENRATNALFLLDLEEIGTRPVAFVTHSMGGLLVKQMLHSGLNLGNARWKAIVDQTKGISFIATPHTGADLANFVKFLTTALSTVSVDNLKANDPHLCSLNNWYSNFAHARIRTEAYCEKKATGWKGLGVIVVDERSANPSIPGVIPYPLDEDHLSICKPTSRTSPLYKGIRRFIEECLPKG